MKKLSKFILPLAITCIFTLQIAPTPALAADDCSKFTPGTPSYLHCIDNPNSNNNSSSGSSSSTGSAGAAFTGDCRIMLGLKSWDCGVNISDKDTLKSGIWQIVVNIAEDIAVIATYLVLGYVIYGGYLYMFSSGDPGKVSTAKKTLMHAFIGLAIVMLAKVIMGTIGAVFGSEDPAGMVSATIGWFIAVSGIVATIFVVYGGVTYMTSAGDPSKVQKAKQTLIYALIGLGIVALSAAISNFVFNTIESSSKSGSIKNTNDQIISKEVHENPTN